MLPGSFAKVALRASGRRPAMIRLTPRSAASMASRWPMPEPAPVMSARLPSSCMGDLQMTMAHVHEDRSVKAVENSRRVDDDVDRFGVFEAVHEALEQGDMLDIERAVQYGVGKSFIAIEPRASP